MKILYIYENISGVSDGVGSSIHNRNTVRALREAGHDLLIAGDTSANGSKTSVDVYRAAYRKLMSGLPSKKLVLFRDIYDVYRDSFSYRKKLEKLYNEFQPDILYERYTSLHSAGLKTSLDKGVPIIVEMHSPWEEKGLYFSYDSLPKYSKKIYGKILKESDAVIVVSTPMKEYVSKWGADADKVHVIPNAVGQEMMVDIAPEEIGYIRNRYGLVGKKVIGFVGSMAPYHGIDRLLDSAGSICKDEKGVVFMLVGAFSKEETKAALLTRIREQGLEHQFVFTGPVEVSAVARYIDSMDICILPSVTNWYGSPIKLFEYGARGKPVVAARLRPIEEIVADGEEGLLFDESQPDSMAAALLFALRNPEAMRQMGSRLREKITHNHTWLCNAQRIEAIANNVIARRGR